jgi:hypothetical protein
MPVLFSPDGGLISPTKEATAAGLAPVKIGEPLAVDLRTFYPGPSIKEWKGKAELMISSRVRLGPENTPPPERVNLLVHDYPFREHPPIQDLGGDRYGDLMLSYTKSYTGSDFKITLLGIELDGIRKKRFETITKTLKALGPIALFASAAPYIAGAAIVVQAFAVLAALFKRQEKVLAVRKDFELGRESRLQAGRYLFWDGEPAWQTFAAKYQLSDENLLVAKETGAAYADRPYFVIRIEGRERPGYDDFEIGAESAQLLEDWGDRDRGATVLNAITGLAAQVNDAKQLRAITELARDLDKATTDDQKALIKDKIQAHAKLFSKDNKELLGELLKGLA